VTGSEGDCVTGRRQLDKKNGLITQIEMTTEQGKCTKTMVQSVGDVEGGGRQSEGLTDEKRRKLINCEWRRLINAKKRGEKAINGSTLLCIFSVKERETKKSI
jgi:hypothetical protein